MLRIVEAEQEKENRWDKVQEGFFFFSPILHNYLPVNALSLRLTHHNVLPLCNLHCLPGFVSAR